MRVEIVGGGPAGLYLAILLKRADRATDVRVLERQVVIWSATNRDQVERQRKGTDDVPVELDDQESIG